METQTNPLFFNARSTVAGIKRESNLPLVVEVQDATNPLVSSQFGYGKEVTRIASSVAKIR